MGKEVVEKFLNLIVPFKDRIKFIYLFGSRARDDWKPDSDYDILIVVDRKDREIVDRFYDAVMEVLLNTGALISLKVFPLSEFYRLKSLKTPFITNVLKEGKRIGFGD